MGREAMANQSGKAAATQSYLNPDLKSPQAQEFEDKLSARIVGQERAVRRITGLYQIYLAGLSHPGRPVGTLSFWVLPAQERHAWLKLPQRCCLATITS